MRSLVTTFALGAAVAGQAACSFDAGGSPADHLLRDDTTADLAATGSTLDHAELDGLGLITPIAYTTGALLAKGAQSRLFSDPALADWGAIDGATAARVALAVPLGDVGDGAPPGVGIA